MRSTEGVQICVHPGRVAALAAARPARRSRRSSALASRRRPEMAFAYSSSAQACRGLGLSSLLNKHTGESLLAAAKKSHSMVHR